MKKVKFIRHSKLEYPYDNYSRLTFNQICGLATDKITPNIHPESQKILLEKFDIEELKSFDLILCSQSRRTEQTTRMIPKLTGKRMEIEKTDNLSEIFFDPAVLTNDKEFTQHGLVTIRKSLFRGMKNGDGAETLEEVLIRAQKLKDELTKLPYDNILCITHSFYMRVLRLFFLENLKNSRNISIEKLYNTLDHNYLEGFEIIL